ncbi:hypothetical protein PTRA_a1541 [Pseudoalteromonas translucida KMM 520]|uniref:GAF domain-containing protein n=1 Tax=Pseudoalteromonas translucida KMM 520 TaxID=1315283 RepID=A0A0U2NG48_9GAMM|nr:GAF domain-containing protein [Pseudoalteromonas translucida]ALS32739.1 hypothetical protein PTRA_a1541 [Pseudoalteromonas translucida KMM 520]
MSSSEEQLDRLSAAAKKNNNITEKIVERTVTFSQVWFTLIAPIIIGVAATYFTSDKKDDLGGLVIALICIVIVGFIIVHIFLSYISHEYSKKESLYAEIVDMKHQKDQEVGKLRSELAQNKLGLRRITDLYSNQISSLYLSAHATDIAIGDLKKMEIDDKNVTEDDFWNKVTTSLSPILQPLIIERESLFGFKSEGKYNVALYFYDADDDDLGIVWRDCDSRLPQRNRNWKPGHGHVGLAFLHKEAKFCPDITMSSELNPSYTSSDGSNYRSFISIPILRCDDNGEMLENDMKPLGVLVLTSAKPEQFIKERDLRFLTIISKHLAIYLSSVETFLSHNVLIENDAE